MEMKKLIERRAELMNELENMVATCETETRAFNEDESKHYAKIVAEIRSIDNTLDAAEEAGKLSQTERREAGNPQNNRTQEELETRAFECFIRGVAPEEEVRVAQNMTAGENGAVIPSSIAHKIIAKVHDISPLFDRATHYNVGGNLSIPKYDETTQKITVAYADEFKALTSSSGKFASVELKGFLAGALTKISTSLVHNSQFDIVEYVIAKMAEAAALWLDDQMLNGTPEKIDGLSKMTAAVTAAATNAITADELIDLQEAIPDRYQGAAIWIMNKKTRTAIRKLKDGQGNYLLQKDSTAKWGYSLMGNDVYTSDAAPAMAASARAIVYGDPSGLAVKVSEQMNIQVLREKYADEHAVGVIGWMELDAKPEDEQKLAVLAMHA